MQNLQVCTAWMDDLLLIILLHCIIQKEKSLRTTAKHPRSCACLGSSSGKRRRRREAQEPPAKTSLLKLKLAETLLSALAPELHFLKLERAKSPNNMQLYLPSIHSSFHFYSLFVFWSFHLVSSQLPVNIVYMHIHTKESMSALFIHIKF